MRIEFDLQFRAEYQPFEQFVFADIGGDHFFHLAILKQQTNAEAVDSSVIADDGEIFCPFLANCSDKIFGDAAQAKAARQDGHAVAEIRNSLVGRCNSFIHRILVAQASACVFVFLGLSQEDGCYREKPGASFR